MDLSIGHTEGKNSSQWVISILLHWLLQLHPHNSQAATKQKFLKHQLCCCCCCIQAHQTMLSVKITFFLLESSITGEWILDCFSPSLQLNTKEISALVFKSIFFSPACPCQESVQLLEITCLNSPTPQNTTSSIDLQKVSFSCGVKTQLMTKEDERLMKAGSHQRSCNPSRVHVLETCWAQLQQVAPPPQKTSLGEGKLRIIGITQSGPRLYSTYKTKINNNNKPRTSPPMDNISHR